MRVWAVLPADWPCLPGTVRFYCAFWVRDIDTADALKHLARLSRSHARFEEPAVRRAEAYYDMEVAAGQLPPELLEGEVPPLLPVHLLEAFSARIDLKSNESISRGKGRS